jgi:hypothetical protein
VTDDRARRIGENEALYRAVNERIEGLNQAFGIADETMTVICECGNLDCTEQIQITVPDYERVRLDPTLFVVMPGHEIEDVEDVVAEQGEFNVVRKHPGEPARIATEADPRS